MKLKLWAGEPCELQREQGLDADRRTGGRRCQERDVEFARLKLAIEIGAESDLQVDMRAGMELGEAREQSRKMCQRERIRRAHPN